MRMQNSFMQYKGFLSINMVKNTKYISNLKKLPPQNINKKKHKHKFETLRNKHISSAFTSTKTQA